MRSSARLGISWWRGVLYVRAGEPRGLTLARHAIEKVSTLQSVAARRQGLRPLATALEARPGTDTQNWPG
jgi:hypothetical protein